jgi:hypothetical protein
MVSLLIQEPLVMVQMKVFTPGESAVTVETGLAGVVIVPLFSFVQRPEPKAGVLAAKVAFGLD